MLGVLATPSLADHVDRATVHDEVTVIVQGRLRPVGHDGPGEWQEVRLVIG
jgi:hypothetical protein